MGEEDGGGSGPKFVVFGGEGSGEDVGVVAGEEVRSGEEGGLGKRVRFLLKKVGLLNRPSKG